MEGLAGLLAVVVVGVAVDVAAGARRSWQAASTSGVKVMAQWPPRARRAALPVVSQSWTVEVLIFRRAATARGVSSPSVRVAGEAIRWAWRRLPAALVSKARPAPVR